MVLCSATSSAGCSQSLVSMFVVSIVVFALVRLSGDPIPIMAPPEASQADIALMRAYLGLDRPWPVQYWTFISHAVQGDFGKSVRFRRPAMELILERYGATLELGGLAVLIVIVVALPVGVYAARPARHRARLRRARAFAALGQAVPPFWLGLLLVLVFGVMLRAAADLRPRHAAARAAARDHARLVRGGRAHAAHALVDARRARQRVRQAGAHQGAAASAR